MAMWQVWLIISGIFFIIEISTVGFLFFWISIGAILALIVSLFTDSLIIQVAVFVISSAILMFFTRPIVNTFLKQKNIPTNKDAIIGKTGIAISDIDTSIGIGQIKIGGETWSAKTENAEAISKDSHVEVTSIEGVKVVVKKVTV